MSIIPRELLVNRSGRQRTISLFHEADCYRNSKTKVYPFTLKEFDSPRGLSFSKRYVQCDSEYEAAILLLGSWKHWCLLKNCRWFKPFHKTMEEERQARIKAMAEKTLIEQAKEGNVTAAKSIVDRDKKNKRGRPSDAEKNKIAKEEKDLEEFLTKAMKNVTPISKAANKSK